MKRYVCPGCGRGIHGQTPFVLHLLEEAGEQGIHTFQLRSLFIGNPSERIAELEDAGHTIRHERERLRGDAIGARYTLTGLRNVSAADATTPARSGTTPSQGSNGSRRPVAGVGRGDGPWRRVWLCKPCGYRERPSRECPRGHEAVRSWVGDFTKAAAA